MAEDLKEIKVSLRNNETEAFIKVPSLIEKGPPEKPLTPEDARKAMSEAGVTTGIKEDVLKKIFDENLFDQEMLVAEAIPPEDGLDSEIEFYFKYKQKLEPSEDKEGRIDYKDVSFLTNVNKGDQLCRRHPPTPGEPGTTVTGKPIPPKAGMDHKLPIGNNTDVSSSDPDLLIASTSGCVSYDIRYHKVEVQPNLEIKGDVDYNTGNIDFIGSLLVKGDVKAGFKVKVAGDLEVGGCVEDAELQAKGDILIKKGFIGRGKGLIRCEGDVTIKYVQGQQVFCEGDLNLGGELMHCQAHVGGNVYITSRKGAIIGGSIQAQGSIEATQIGNENYTQTEIAAGYDYILVKQLEEINDELKKIEENQEKIIKGLKTLAQMKTQLKGKLPPEQEALFGRMQETLKQYPKQKAELEEEKKRLETEIEKRREAFVKVTKRLYPGVKIIIGKFHRVFNEQFDGKTFREIKGEIIPTA